MASLTGGLDEMKNSLANSGAGAELGASVSGPQSYSLVSGKAEVFKSLKSEHHVNTNQVEVPTQLLNTCKKQLSVPLKTNLDVFVAFLLSGVLVIGNMMSLEMHPL